MSKKLRCFLKKFTQLTKILHDRRSRQIPSLVTTMLGPMLAPDLNKATINFDPDKEDEKPANHWNAAKTGPEVLNFFLWVD